MGQRALRIAVVTPLFPIRAEPYRGKPIYETVRRLREFAEVRAWCLTARYPAWLRPSSYQYRTVDADYQPDGVPTEYVTYPAIPVATRPFNPWLGTRALLPRLRPWTPDVVLAYWLYPEGRSALLAARNLGAAAVVGSRGSDLKRIPDGWTRRMTAATVREADRVITVSEDLRRAAIALGADGSRVTTIVNGCDTTVFRPAPRMAAREELGLGPDDEVVVYVGHLQTSKGVFDLAAAARQLRRRRGRLRTVLLGEGVDEAQLRSQTPAEDGFLLPGAKPAAVVTRWLAAADVFCLPSYSEGCPNVVIEALACHRPVVATTVGGIPELVDGETGILVPPGDPGALENALDQALGMPWPENAFDAAGPRSWREAARQTYEVCREASRAIRTKRS
ncbi:MAG: glycosyltransferase [Bryobacteraceae bacterium]